MPFSNIIHILDRDLYDDDASIDVPFSAAHIHAYSPFHFIFAGRCRQRIARYVTEDGQPPSPNMLIVDTAALDGYYRLLTATNRSHSRSR